MMLCVDLPTKPVKGTVEEKTVEEPLLQNPAYNCEQDQRALEKNLQKGGGRTAERKSARHKPCEAT